jgi:hypothetical protein
MRLSPIGLFVTFGIGLLWTPFVATAQQPERSPASSSYRHMRRRFPRRPRPFWMRAGNSCMRWAGWRDRP